MDHTMFTYEAREQTLVIHLPKELDHHNCRNLKSDTDLQLKRIILTGSYLILHTHHLWTPRESAYC